MKALLVFLTLTFFCLIFVLTIRYVKVHNEFHKQKIENKELQQIILSQDSTITWQHYQIQLFEGR